MKFLVDANLGRKFVNLMQKAGYDTIFAKDLSPLSTDEEILAKANVEERVIITNDKDFGELVFRSGKAARGVILLRTIATGSVERFELAKGVLDKSKSKFIVVEEGRVRIRPL
ncbi:MAG: DUF5615 family PIN-like protein [Candidatus Aenigmatarchaeota archaeon]